MSSSSLSVLFCMYVFVVCISALYLKLVTNSTNSSLTDHSWVACNLHTCATFGINQSTDWEITNRPQLLHLLITCDNFSVCSVDPIIRSPLVRSHLILYVNQDSCKTDLCWSNLVNSTLWVFYHFLPFSRNNTFYM